jgi:sec-independent protein translocase protein TatA
MWQGFTGWHALIILVIILLLFGAPKLPALARSLGQSMKILKTEVRSDKDEPAATESAEVAPKADEPDSGKSA